MKNIYKIIYLIGVLNATITSVNLSCNGNYIGAFGWLCMAAFMALCYQGYLLFQEQRKLTRECLDGWQAANDKIKELNAEKLTPSPAQLPAPCHQPRRARTTTGLSVVEKLDALPHLLLTTLPQREIADLAGVSQSGVSVYSRTRGIVRVRASNRAQKNS